MHISVSNEDDVIINASIRFDSVKYEIKYRWRTDRRPMIGERIILSFGEMSLSSRIGAIEHDPIGCSPMKVFIGMIFPPCKDPPGCFLEALHRIGYEYTMEEY